MISDPAGGGFPSPLAASTAYLWGPFTLASCLGASTGSLENAAVLVAILGGVTGDSTVAGAGFAAAAYLGLHPILLAVRRQSTCRQSANTCTLRQGLGPETRKGLKGYHLLAYKHKK